MGLARVSSVVVLQRGLAALTGAKLGLTASFTKRALEGAFEARLVTAPGAAHNASRCISGLTVELPVSRRF